MVACLAVVSSSFRSGGARGYGPNGQTEQKYYEQAGGGGGGGGGGGVVGM